MDFLRSTDERWIRRSIYSRLGQIPCDTWKINGLRVRVSAPNNYLCNMSGTVRQQKFGRLIQKELSDIFQRDQRGFLDQAFITIVDVRMSPDLSVARVYISMMLAKDKNAVLGKLDVHKKEIRKALGERIRNQARIVPELAFFIDEVGENAQRMDDLIKSLNIPPENKKEE